jgi:hypothetical protein
VNEQLLAVVAIVAPLGGVALGWALSVLGEARKWRRDWMAQRTQRQEEFYADLIDTMDRLCVLVKVAFHAGLGQARHPDQERIDTVTESWRSLLARSRLYVRNPVLEALFGLDRVRGRVAEAINASDADAATKAVAELDPARNAVLDAVASEHSDMTAPLYPHILTFRQRMLGRLRGL